ncbi:MAG: SAM-dependent methyltransferase [Candidatus Competibacteraceae bacterium]|nr:SAM-dependent methyltransferase [Candidatus Competibacteraceae bacterium]
MDRDARNRLLAATQAARTVLEQDYTEQLEGTFAIPPDGGIAVEPGDHLDAMQRQIRTQLVAAIHHAVAGGLSAKEAVMAWRREAAFTTLNRFAALKMLEARGLAQECLSRHEQSAGFKEFTGLAPGLAELPDHGYRLYLECLFDEIGREVQVLFDRRDPASLLWPRPPVLLRLLGILNDEKLAGVWQEDETIGWIYQYFNSDDDRQRARYDDRGRPKSPQNAYELAVRNQFFTPRYVVEFLIDNTLGRLWYEMTQGVTRLRQQCRSLVIGPDEAAISRPVKDPREIRLLDPACGSMHFGLYAFDVLLTIYEEAWEKDAGAELRTIYADDKAAFLRDVPRLILAHNIHGIDVDPRAAQIAALALWMRAQRAYHDLGVPRGERPPIKQTHVVVAEPMPGEADLAQEFAGRLEELLGELFTGLLQELKLAGVAGSLLRVEARLPELVRAVYGEHGELFQADDQIQWSKADARLLAALRDYAEQAEKGGYARRLFAQDAARGLGFIDVCQQRFDVVVMNPPFGESARDAKAYLAAAYPNAKNDLLAAFVERGLQWLHPGGMLGAITSRTGFFLSSYQKWREEQVLGVAEPLVFADLGYGVMDAAMVEAAAYCLKKRVSNH